MCITFILFMKNYLGSSGNLPARPGFTGASQVRGDAGGMAHIFFLDCNQDVCRSCNCDCSRRPIGLPKLLSFGFKKPCDFKSAQLFKTCTNSFFFFFFKCNGIVLNFYHRRFFIVCGGVLFFIFVLH